MASRDSLRRRGAAATTGGGGGTTSMVQGNNGKPMQVPLLDDDEGTADDDSRADLSPRQFDRERPGLLCNAFSGILGPCTRIILDWVRNIGLIPKPPPPPLILSATQRDRLQALWDAMRAPYEPSNPEHEAALRRLWSLAFPARELPSMQTPLWKEMGWQGTDPATDFRSAGFVSLEHLLYLAEKHPAVFKRLMNKVDGTRSEWEYPFAVGGVNVSFMLTELLQLRKEPEVPTTRAFRGFAKLLASDANALEELFTATFELLDFFWLQQRASYMEFPQVMKATKEAVENALASGRYNTVADLAAHLNSLRQGAI